MKQVLLLLTLLAFTWLEGAAQTVTDIDGNVYPTVTIGNQTWMGANLKVTHNRNGNAILKVMDNGVWAGMTSGALCDYNNNPANSAIYGHLYNWYAVTDSSHLAPVGWHVATDEDLFILSGYLGGDLVAGGKLKETGTAHWLDPNTGATNETGFAALPGGLRNMNGSTFSFLGMECLLWSSTAAAVSGAFSRTLIYYNNEFRSDGYNPTFGFSVRCVKDNPEGINQNQDGNEFKIYPNPATDFAVVSITTAARQSVLRICDVTGKIVFQKENPEKENRIDLSTLARGIYVVEVSGNQFSSRKKLVKD